MKMITVSGCLSGKCPAKPLLQEDLNHHGVKEKYQPLYQKLVLLMWNDSKTNTIPGYRFAISLSFCNGCKMDAAGCKSGSVGATSNFHFAICCFAHVCPVSGFRTERGGFLDRSVKARTCGKQGLVWVQNNGCQ